MRYRDMHDDYLTPAERKWKRVADCLMTFAVGLGVLKAVLKVTMLALFLFS